MLTAWLKRRTQILRPLGLWSGLLATCMVGCNRPRLVTQPTTPPAKTPCLLLAPCTPTVPRAQNSSETSEAPKPVLGPWNTLRDTLFAEYQSHLPPSDDEYYEAEKQSLSLNEGSPEWAGVSAILAPNRRDGTRLHSWCRSQFAAAQLAQFESCSLNVLGNGAALLLTFTTECGSDSCATQGWVRTAQLTQFLRLPFDVGGTVEATPDGTSLLFDSVSSPEAAPTSTTSDKRMHAGADVRIETEIFDLATRSVRSFAGCFSMQLSPQGKYFLCRDGAANVLSVPVRGGKPRLIAASGFSASQVDTVLYAYIWPEPVSFPKPNRLVYKIQTTGDAQPGVQLREIDWTE